VNLRAGAALSRHEILRRYNWLENLKAGLVAARLGPRLDTRERFSRNFTTATLGTSPSGLRVVVPGVIIRNPSRPENKFEPGLDWERSSPSVLVRFRRRQRRRNGHTPPLSLVRRSPGSAARG